MLTVQQKDAKIVSKRRMLNAWISDFDCYKLHVTMSNGKKPGCLGYMGDYAAQLQCYTVSSCFLMVRAFATVTGPLGSQAPDFVQLTSLVSTNWLCHAVPMGPNTWEVLGSTDIAIHRNRKLGKSIFLAQLYSIV